MFKKIIYLSSLALALSYSNLAASQTAPQKELSHAGSGQRAEMGIGAGNYFIQNQWMTEQFLNLAKGKLAADNQGGVAPAAQWYFERVEDTTFYRIRNRAQPSKAIHIENGKLEAGSVEDGWWSAQWELENVDEPKQFRLKNRWKPKHYINVENGGLTAGPIQAGWVSAMWKLSPAKTQ